MVAIAWVVGPADPVLSCAMILRRRTTLGPSIAAQLLITAMPALAQSSPEVAPSGSAAPPLATLAEPPAPTVPRAWENPPPPKMVKRTYSSLVAFTDVVVLTGFIIGVGVESPPLIIGSGVGYLIGGPIAHTSQGRYRTAGGSLGLRVLTPLAGAGIGAAFFAGSSEGFISGEAIGAFLGASVGILVAPILDASFLARREWFDDLEVVPEVAGTPGGATFGLRGSFLS